MKRLLFVVATYVLLFPAVAVLTFLIGEWMSAPKTTWNGEGVVVVILVGYMILALPAFATAIIHFVVDWLGVGFTPLAVTLGAVVASEVAFRTLAGGSLAGLLPHIDLFTAIAGLTCCLVAGTKSGIWPRPRLS